MMLNLGKTAKLQSNRHFRQAATAASRLPRLRAASMAGHGAADYVAGDLHGAAVWPAHCVMRTGRRTDARGE